MNPRWKPDEFDLLRRRFAEGRGDALIADEANALFWGGRPVRTADAVRLRRNKLRLHRTPGGRPARAGWTDADREELRRLCSLSGGTRKSAVAEVMKRPLSQVTAEMKRLGLTLARPDGRQCERPGAAGAVAEGGPPDEALRNRCRQLAADLGRDAQLSLWHLKHEHGYTGPALASLLEEGGRWFESTAFGVRLTEAGRRELLGGKAA